MTTVELTRQLNACEAVLDLLEPWIEQAEGHYNVLTDKNQEIVRTFRKARPKPLPPQDDDPPPFMQRYCREDTPKRRRREANEINEVNEVNEVNKADENTDENIKANEISEMPIPQIVEGHGADTEVDFTSLEREAEKLLENI